MEQYLIEWKNLIEQSSVYTGFFVNLPTPLNDVYFLTVIVVVIIIAAVKWILDLIRLSQQHRSIKKRQNEIREAQLKAELEVLRKEEAARDSQKSTDELTEMMRMYLMSQMMGQNSSSREYSTEDDIIDVDFTELKDTCDMPSENSPSLYIEELPYENKAALVPVPRIPGFENIKPKKYNQSPKIERPNVFVGDGSSEFEKIMAQLAEDESLKKTFLEKDAKERAKAKQKEAELDAQLKSLQEYEIKTNETSDFEKELEKRRDLALKIAQKTERKRG